MKTKKQIFYLNPPDPDPYMVKGDNPSYFEPTDRVITWTVPMYDHVLVMPELTLLVEKHYFLN